MHDEIQHIISGKSEIRFGTAIQAVASYLTRSQTASPMAQEYKQSKQEETKRLIGYIKLLQPNTRYYTGRPAR